ncbi:MAG TPA: DinB family protein [Cyclobacteriaceae bacterium]|nr:DinB family protein [Cyclobacteriaceae bacterium]HRJ81288.1 DinB family protein [Cyclobacteriaceae bacterium]
MNKTQITVLLTQKHNAFMEEIKHLSDNDFIVAPSGKWSAGQQLDHIVRSAGPVNLAFSLPGFFLTLAFGKANRPSRTYDGVVEKYQAKLALGGKAPSQFIPKRVSVNQRNQLIKKLERIVQSLTRRAEKYTEAQLDNLLLPHPLLGKLTFREMLYFTAYHVEHHHKQVIANLKETTKSQRVHPL